MPDVEPTARFVQVVQGAQAGIPLDEAALLIAAHAHPGLDVGAHQERLDELAAAVRSPTLDALSDHLFGDLEFAGDHADYYDPRNSYLDEVLSRRVGIPITLAVVMMEVGRRVGVPLDGVSMPGHFLVRDKVDPGVFVDPFARGEVLDRRGCEARFHAVHGPEAVFDPAFLEPVGKRVILARMLANLEAASLRRDDRVTLTWVLRLRAALPGASLEEHRRLASVLASAGAVDQAAAALEGAVPELDAEAGEVASALARRFRASLN